MTEQQHRPKWWHRWLCRFLGHRWERMEVRLDYFGFRGTAGFHDVCTRCAKVKR